MIVNGLLLHDRYTGMLEAVRVRREGFAYRPFFSDFVNDYKRLAYKLTDKVFLYSCFSTVHIFLFMMKRNCICTIMIAIIIETVCILDSSFFTRNMSKNFECSWYHGLENRKIKSEIIINLCRLCINITSCLVSLL